MAGEPTPRPWARHQESTAIWAGSTVVADCQPWEGFVEKDMPPADEALANAALIVRAVNAHEAVVAALEEAEEWLENAFAVAYGPDAGATHLSEKVSAALRLAREEK